MNHGFLIWLALFVGAAIGAAIGATKEATYWKEKTFKAGVAEYKCDSATGECKFAFKECKP